MTPGFLTKTPSAASQKSALAQSLSVVGTVYGLAVGYYAGFTLLVPAAFALVLGFILSKGLPSRKAVLMPASIVAGHLAWMILGASLLNSWTPIMGELVVLGLGLLWLLARPCIWSVATLGGIEAIEFLFLAYSVFQPGFGTSIHKAYVVHANLYMIVAFQLGKILVSMAKEKKLQALGANQSLQSASTAVMQTAEQPARQP